MIPTQNPPLYLHVTSTNKEGLEKAVALIDDLMKKELPNLVDERRFRRREPEQVERDEYGRVRPSPYNTPPGATLFIPFNSSSSGNVSLINGIQRKWPEERIPVDLEPIPGFNLRAQVVGQGGAYVKHIQQKTRCKVQIKGRGSGFMEPSTGRESDEPMFLHVAYVTLLHPFLALQRLRQLALILITFCFLQWSRPERCPERKGLV